MKSTRKMNYWTSGKFAPDYNPSDDEVPVPLPSTRRIFKDFDEAGDSFKVHRPALPSNSMESEKRCGKIHPCGHPCFDFAWQNRVYCSRCTVPLTVIREGCGHETTVYCSSGPPLSECMRPCTRKLPCGHPCLNQCYQPCISDCRNRDCWKLKVEKQKREAEARGVAYTQAQSMPSIFNNITEDHEEWTTNDLTFDGSAGALAAGVAANASRLRNSIGGSRLSNKSNWSSSRN